MNRMEIDAPEAACVDPGSTYLGGRVRCERPPRVRRTPIAALQQPKASGGWGCHVDSLRAQECSVGVHGALNRFCLPQAAYILRTFSAFPLAVSASGSPGTLMWSS